jgi:hypothetical protein
MQCLAKLGEACNVVQSASQAMDMLKAAKPELDFKKY